MQQGEGKPMQRFDHHHRGDPGGGGHHHPFALRRLWGAWFPGHGCALLYVGAMFHDIGLTEGYRQSQLRFEVDGANAARTFLRSYGIPEASVELVWDAIALHTTPGIPEPKKPEVALVTAGVEMDVLGFAHEQFTQEQRDAVVAAHPRGADFKTNIVDAFYEGMRHRPDSTFGTVNDDVLAFKDASFQRTDFCKVILGSDWAS
jgi:hypothetical protein